MKTPPILTDGGRYNTLMCSLRLTKNAAKVSFI